MKRDDFLLEVNKRVKLSPVSKDVLITDIFYDILTDFITELEGALKPFKLEASTWADRVPDSDHPIIKWDAPDETGEPAKFTVGDLRRAAEVLKNKP